MINFVLIRKNSDIEEKTIRSFNISQFWKKCGFSNDTDFTCIHTFDMTDYMVSLYTKTNGKSNMINKYELPPPVDKDLYYGSIGVIVHKDFDEKQEPIGIIKYTKQMWLKDYETLMGGFEDADVDDNDDCVDSVDEELRKEEESIPDSMKTKEGYVKDNFVVDDVEEIEEEDDDEEDDDEEDEYSYSDSELEEEDYI